MQLNKKNKLLVLGVLVMSLLCYFLAVKKTMLLREEYNLLSEKDKLAQNLGVKLATLAKKEQNLNSQFNQLNLGATSIQNNLLRVLNEQSLTYGVKIIEFNAPHVVQANNTESKTHIFTLEGSYTAILSLIHELEKRGSFGRVIHLNFEKKKDYRNRKAYLQATVFLAQLK